MSGTDPPSWTHAAAVAAAASLVLAIYVLRLDRVAGLVVDDAWYVLLARALAQGDGYRLISSASTAIQPVVPPGFPAILSIVYRFSPEFPQNVLLLKSVSIVAMIGVGLLTYRYFTSYRGVPRQVAAGIALATVLTPGFIFLATSTVMAECVFTLGQLLVIVVVDRSARQDRNARMDNVAAGRQYVLFAALIAAATMLVRTTGVAVIIAVILYLLNERRWQRALLFTAVTLACLMPWTIYARIHEPTSAQRLEHGGSIAYAYSDSMRMKRAAEPASGRATLRDLTVRVGGNLFNVLGRDISGVFIPTFLRGADESGEEVVALGGMLGLTAGSMGNAGATIFISFLISLVMLIGYVSAARTRLSAAELLVPISIAMIVVVPFWTFRYVLPLAPFLFFYFLEGLRVLAIWIARSAPAVTLDPWSLARVAVLCIIGLDAYDHARYILDARNDDGVPRIDWVADSHEIDTVLNWMKQNLTEDGAVATTNPALVFLETGRKALAIDDYAGNRGKWKALGVRYVVSLRQATLPEAPDGSYKLLYQTQRRKLWVIEI